MYELSGYLDFKEIACNEAELRQYLLFDDKVSVSTISKQLCRINDTRIPEITNYLQGQIDVAKIIKFVSYLPSYHSYLICVAKQ